jgi:DNA-binding response OmpR family regulator/anti-sigma regulatory factor (Ser/Thr protein kinase)
MPGRMVVSPEPTEVVQVILEAVDTIRPLIEGKGLEMRVALEQEFPILYIDPTRVRQVLLNLLNNARRFTDQGSITVRAELEGGEVRVSVHDTGIGITPEDRGKIFEEFRQLDGSTTRQHNGVGLGLAISRQFVELHGGRMWVESEGRGRGSTFHFTLPVADEAQQAASPGPLSDTRISPLPPAGPPKTLVVVDQDPRVEQLIQRRLEDYQVVRAEGVSQVPLMADRVRPRAVVVSASDGEGWESLGRLGPQLERWDLPLILCPLVGDRQMGHSLGVADYLVKPVSRQTLLEALDQVGDGARRVLILDDDPRVVRLLSRMIRSRFQEYHIIRAYSGEDGLIKMRRRPPDLVLLDLMMPQVDGYTVLERMREDEALRDIPVVVVTAKGSSPEDMRRLGAKTIQVTRRRGFSNEEALCFLKNILKASETLPFAYPLEAV